MIKIIVDYFIRTKSDTLFAIYSFLNRLSEKFKKIPLSKKDKDSLSSCVKETKRNVYGAKRGYYDQ